MMNWFF